MQMIRQASKRNSGLRPWGRALGIATFILVFTVSQARAVPFKSSLQGFFHSAPITALDEENVPRVVPGASSVYSGFDSMGNTVVCAGLTTSSQFVDPTGACGAEEFELAGTTAYVCQYNGAEDVFNSTSTDRLCVPISCYDDFPLSFIGCTATGTSSVTATGGDGRAEGSSGSWTSSSTITYPQMEMLESGSVRFVGTVRAKLQGDFELADGVSLPGEAEVDQDLMAAVTAGDVEAVQAALDEGASVHGRGADGETPLFIAASPDLAQLLLDAGASVHARNNFGMTPLHDASILGRTEIVRLLLEAGAAVYARDERGMTPLDWVENPPWGVPQASDELIQLLKDAGGE